MGFEKGQEYAIPSVRSDDDEVMKGRIVLGIGPVIDDLLDYAIDGIQDVVIPVARGRIDPLEIDRPELV